jgi:hypothetical protein
VPVEERSQLVKKAMGEPRVPVMAEKDWSVLGIELGCLAAMFGGLMAKVKPWKSQPKEALDAMEDVGTGHVHYWAPALTSLLLSMPDASFADDGTGYSKASYYVSLGTYVLALPGLFSLVTRSVKSKTVKKEYTLPGPKAPGGMMQKELAGKLLFYFTTKRGFELKDAGKVVTFKGKLAQRRGQAAFLTFCVFLSLLSLGLVVSTVEAATLGEGQGLGTLWYAISLVSPLAGKYYLDNSGGEQEFQLKMVTSDDEMETLLVVQGDDAEVEGMRVEFDFQEKGMVRVKGLFEDQIKG